PSRPPRRGEGSRSPRAPRGTPSSCRWPTPGRASPTRSCPTSSSRSSPPRRGGRRARWAWGWPWSTGSCSGTGGRSRWIPRWGGGPPSASRCRAGRWPHRPRWKGRQPRPTPEEAPMDHATFESPAAAEGAGTRLEGARLLIVDDEFSMRDSLEQWFRRDGYRTATAQDATEALQRLQEAAYDVVLLDIKLPGVDGLELQRR